MLIWHFKSNVKNLISPTGIPPSSIPPLTLCSSSNKWFFACFYPSMDYIQKSFSGSWLSQYLPHHRDWGELSVRTGHVWLFTYGPYSTLQWRHSPSFTSCCHSLLCLLLRFTFPRAQTYFCWFSSFLSVYDCIELRALCCVIVLLVNTNNVNIALLFQSLKTPKDKSQPEKVKISFLPLVLPSPHLSFLQPISISLSLPRFSPCLVYLAALRPQNPKSTKPDEHKDPTFVEIGWFGLISCDPTEPRTRVLV